MNFSLLFTAASGCLYSAASGGESRLLSPPSSILVFFCVLKKVRLASATLYYGRRIIADCSFAVSSEET